MRIIKVLLLIVIVSCGCNKDGVFKWESDYDVSIMSFNLRYDTEEDGKNQWKNRKQACVRMLKETLPSVFGIQEGLNNQLNYLKENLTLYKCVGVARDDGHSSGEFNSVFYRKDKFELLDSGTFWLSETPDSPSMGWDAECRRIVTWAKLKDKVKSKAFFIFNTHLDHKGKTARKESAKLLVKKISEIADENSPIFITGDFNMLIRNSSLNPVLDKYYSARRFAKYTDNKKSFNFFGLWILSRNIDFIFYNNAKALSFKTVTEDYGADYISDHYPIITHFDF